MNRSRIQILPTRAVGFLAVLAVLTVVVSAALLLFNLHSKR